MTANQNPNADPSGYNDPFIPIDDNSAQSLSSVKSLTSPTSNDLSNSSPESEFVNFEAQFAVEKVVGKRVNNNQVSIIFIKSNNIFSMLTTDVIHRLNIKLNGVDAIPVKILGINHVNYIATKKSMRSNERNVLQMRINRIR